MVQWNSRKAYIDRIIRICDYHKIPYDDFNMSFIRDAKSLSEITRDDFLKMSPEYGGFISQQLQTSHPYVNSEYFVIFKAVFII